MLLGRRSGVGFPSIGPARLFLFFQVRRMIGGDDVGRSLEQTFPDGFVVVGRDVVGKRVGSEAIDGIPVITEPQRPWIAFRRHGPALYLCSTKTTHATLLPKVHQRHS